MISVVLRVKETAACKTDLCRAWNVHHYFAQGELQLMPQETRAETDPQSNTNLLAHVVHADSCGYIVPFAAMVEADELCREDHPTEEAERKRGENSFPGAYDEFQILVSL